MKMYSRALALAALMVLTAPVAAHADADGYAPPPPVGSTLAGSTAAGECAGDLAWIDIDLVLLDPDDQLSAGPARLVLSDGTQSESIELGELVDDQLSSRVLWPGTTVDADSKPTGWTGWQLQGGEWVQTEGNFGWTRGDITATLEAGASLAVPLAYPATTAECSANPPGESFASSLPATGMNAAVLPLAIAGAVAVIGGGAFLLVRRRFAQR